MSKKLDKRPEILGGSQDWEPILEVRGKTWDLGFISEVGPGTLKVGPKTWDPGLLS